MANNRDGVWANTICWQKTEQTGGTGTGGASTICWQKTELTGGTGTGGASTICWQKTKLTHRKYWWKKADADSHIQLPAFRAQSASSSSSSNTCSRGNANADGNDDKPWQKTQKPRRARRAFNSCTPDPRDLARAVDPHSFFADPDPAVSSMRIRIQMRIRILSQPYKNFKQLPYKVLKKKTKRLIRT